MSKTLASALRRGLAPAAPTLPHNTQTLHDALFDAPRPQRNAAFEFLVGTVNAIGIEQHISAPRSPWQNPFAERVIGSIRRDLLDRVIVLNERHATMLLREYQKTYYNPWRTHLGLEKDTPTGRRAQSPADGAEIVSIPILGGLHHRYERRRPAA